MGMIQTAPNAGPAWSHQDQRHVIIAGAGPALVTRDFKQVDDVKPGQVTLTIDAEIQPSQEPIRLENIIV